MSDRVRMTQELDGVPRTIRVPRSAIGQYSAAGWQVDDSPEPPPPPRPARRRPARTSEPSPTPTGEGTPSTALEEE